MKLRLATAWTAGIIIFISMLTASCTRHSTDPALHAAGEEYADEHIATYAIPEGFPKEHESRFAVSVEGHYTAVYNDLNLWGGSVGFCNFDLSENQTVQIEVEYKGNVEGIRVLPSSLGIKAEYRDSLIILKIDKPGTYLTLLPNGNPRGDALHIFANPRSGDEWLPAGYSYDSLTQTHRFGKGYYHLRDMFPSKELRLSGKESVYVAAGAVVDGEVRVKGGNGTRIAGHGMLMNRVEEGIDNNRIVLSCGWSEGGDISGITVFGRRNPGWVMTVDNSRQMKYEGVKIISTRYASTDGLDVINCQDMKFGNMFIRSCDDAVAIKGLADAKRKPADCPPNRNMTFERMQLWNDCNNAFGMGAETRASAYENITLRNCDILSSYDDPNHHEKLSERAALNICALHGTWFRNILFEDIRIEHCERLIGICFEDSFWFGTLPGDQSTEGGAENITFRSVHSMADSGSRIANEIRLAGWKGKDMPAKALRNIVLEDIRICNTPLTNQDSTHLHIINKELVEVKFASP